MKFETFISMVGDMPFFELPLLLQLSDEAKGPLLLQLHQWTKAGKLLRLRRGMYTLADTYRKTAISTPQLANELYRPSYLSGVWALSFYGLIPEKVAIWTSATTRVTRHFENSLGTFSYASLKKTFFFGLTTHLIEGVPVWIAEPEKALLDYFHWHTGVWSEERLQEMRFQNLNLLNLDTLSDYAMRWQSPRLIQMTDRLIKRARHSEEGYVVL